MKINAQFNVAPFTCRLKIFSSELQRTGQWQPLSVTSAPPGVTLSSCSRSLAATKRQDKNAKVRCKWWLCDEEPRALLVHGVIKGMSKLWPKFCE